MLSWFFGTGGSEDLGPNDSITTTFKGNKYYSLAREVIQNSLDAVLDRAQPVRVAFSVFDLERPTMPGLFDLGETVARCKEKFSYHSPFMKFCDRALQILEGETLRCLRIADYNTKGLEYGEGQTPFYAFMQAVGVTLKETAGAGGSFGFGKGAYYAASMLRTLIVSSVYGEGSFIFQGKARLTTHMDGEVKKDYTGLFGLVPGKPIEDRSGVPEELVRAERGTDVIIVGFDDDEHTWKDSLIKSVLNNFWLAIWEGNLVVDVEDVTIEKNSLEATISRYFSETDPDGRVNDPETWNPYPYFKAVKYKDGGPNNHFFEKDLPTLGPVRMYMLVKENLPNRTVYMRGPKMTVQKKGNNLGSNYVAVFVCDNDRGNEILRAMENPEHNAWKKNNYTENDRPHPDAIAAEGEIREFVNECLGKLRSQNPASRQKIMGLEQYLSIPEDLLADADGSGNNGRGGAESSGEITETETPVERAVKRREAQAIVLTATKQVTVVEPATGEPDMGDGVIFTGTGGGDGGGGGGGESGGVPGGHVTPGSETGTKPVKVPLNLRYRVVAQRTDEGIVHLVKVYAQNDASAEIEFFVGVDNDSGGDDGSLVISSAAMDGAELDTSGNKLTGVALTAGENTLEVRFDSDEKHSVRIKSYEV